MEHRNGIENELIEGRNAITEALRAGRPIDKIYLAGGENDRALGFISTIAREKGIAVVECDRRKLDAMSRTHAHQGAIAVCAVRDYADVEDMFRLAASRGEDPFLIICDEITDGYNLGAIIRSAECAGAHGVIIPKRRSAGLTAAVSKASAGAAEYLPVARVANLRTAMDDLKKRGVWLYGTAADGDCALWQTRLTGPIALVIGSEGSGMGRLVREGCDFVLSLPMKGRISSLNASVAAALVMYEVMRQRSL